jgi:hypothetical protein
METADSGLFRPGDAGIEKYFSIYERLVEEARALETAAAEHVQFDAESVHA